MAQGPLCVCCSAPWVTALLATTLSPTTFNFLAGRFCQTRRSCSGDRQQSCPALSAENRRCRFDNGNELGAALRNRPALASAGFGPDSPPALRWLLLLPAHADRFGLA